MRIYGFGCPRAGTTFLRKALEAMPEVDAAKLPETDTRHPVHSRDGLVRMVEAFRVNVLFVRIVRHPLEIVESFAWARVRAREGAAEYAGLARNSDERILEFIRKESAHVAVQRGRVPLLELRYEKLADSHYRTWAARQLTHRGIPEDQAALFRRALDRWGQDPVREGRLRDGVGEVLSPLTRRQLAEQLADVIEREGYAP